VAGIGHRTVDAKAAGINGAMPCPPIVESAADPALPCLSAAHGLSPGEAGAFKTRIGAGIASPRRIRVSRFTFTTAFILSPGKALKRPEKG
jgi:hypothetical protein